jgi:poly(A) polymerase
MIKMDLSHGEAAMALKVVRVLNTHHFIAYFAGGCVRDFLMGKTPHDIDIATNASPDEIQKLFNKTIAVGKQFGVIIVCLDELLFEVATFRCDGEYVDGRRPESVVFTTPDEDAKRRDFTVNGLFYDPIKEEVIDFVGGQTDLKEKRIRAIGDAKKRFEEDKLRLLRAIRFSSNLNFEIEEKTYHALKVMADQIRGVSKERIHDELSKILTRNSPEHGLSLLIDTGMLGFIFPIVMNFFRTNQKALKNTLELLKRVNSKDEIGAFAVVYYAYFFNAEASDLSRCISEWKEMRLSNQVIEGLSELFKALAEFKRFEKLRLGKQKIFVKRASFEMEFCLYQHWIKITEAETSGVAYIEAKVSEFKKDLLNSEAYLNGHDLISIGFKPGPRMKDILDELYLRQLEGKVKNKEDALRMAKEI